MIEALTIAVRSAFDAASARLDHEAHRLRAGAVRAATGVALAVVAALLAFLASAAGAVALFASLETRLGIVGALWSATGLLASLAILAALASRHAARRP